MAAARREKATRREMWATLPLHKTFVRHAFPFPPQTRTGFNGLGFKKRKPPHLRVFHTNVVGQSLHADDAKRVPARGGGPG